MKTSIYAIFWSVSLALLFLVDFCVLPVVYFASAKQDLGDCFEQLQKNLFPAYCEVDSAPCKTEDDCEPYAGTEICLNGLGFSYVYWDLVKVLGHCEDDLSETKTCPYCRRVCAKGMAYIPDESGEDCGIFRCNVIYWQLGKCLPPIQ